MRNYSSYTETDKRATLAFISVSCLSLSLSLSLLLDTHLQPFPAGDGSWRTRKQTVGKRKRERGSNYYWVWLVSCRYRITRFRLESVVWNGDHVSGPRRDRGSLIVCLSLSQALDASITV